MSEGWLLEEGLADLTLWRLVDDVCPLGFLWFFFVRALKTAAFTLAGWELTIGEDVYEAALVEVVVEQGVWFQLAVLEVRFDSIIEKQTLLKSNLLSHVLGFLSCGET